MEEAQSRVLVLWSLDLYHHGSRFLVHLHSALFPSTMDSSTGSDISKQGARRVHTVNIREVDVAAGLDSDKPLDPKVAARIKCVHSNYRQPSKNKHSVGAKSTGTLCHLCAVRNSHLS